MKNQVKKFTTIIQQTYPPRVRLASKVRVLTSPTNKNSPTGLFIEWLK